jgi:hypothetical protein
MKQLSSYKYASCVLMPYLRDKNGDNAIQLSSAAVMRFNIGVVGKLYCLLISLLQLIILINVSYIILLLLLRNL